MQDIQINEKLISFLTFLPVFFISITVHEFAHAFIAWRFGDDTAKKQGRLTLNPIKHADLIGTVIMPLASFATGFALIGWAKPVPIDRRNFKNPFKDDAAVSFAGPLSNFVLAVLLFILYYFFDHSSVNNIWIKGFLWYGVFLNVFLFLFNLLPIPPLDGCHILFDLFPGKLTAGLLNMGLYGSLILMFFVYSPLWNYFMKLLTVVLNLFLKIAGY